MMRALVIHPDTTFEVKQIDATLNGLQGLVGGWIEATNTYRTEATIFMNEEGKIHGLPYNELATDLWQALDSRITGWIAGTAVVLGPVDAEGNETPVTDEVLATFSRLVSA